jgi:metal-responsive CopG/Arc/MetJ family transcriptional regulator
MKPIQIMMDEKLLDELDAEEEVRRLGRSAVFRGLAAEYIEHHRRKTISSMYRRAYGMDSEGLGKEFTGWENEGRWPSK